MKTSAAAKGKKRKKAPAPSITEIPASMIDDVCDRLARNLTVRRTLPGKGRLHIDRQLPFLCVYRQPPDHVDAGTERLVKGEAAYLVAPGTGRYRNQVSELVRRVVQTLSPEFGAFLIVEVWAAADGGKANDPAVPSVRPTFAIHAPASNRLARVVEALEQRLERIKILKQGVKVEVHRGSKGHPPERRPLLSATEARDLNCSMIGLAVPPVYRKPDSPDEFPLLSASLRQNLGLALRQAYFEFSRACTTHRPKHYHSLGRKKVVKAVWEIDRRLALVSNQFDYLLQVTPVNTKRAWVKFQRDRFEKAPEFHYRPFLFDPSLLKRQLYKIPIERVEDPALQRLFREKQEELELKISMLRDRDTRRFLPESLLLFGGVQDRLLSSAMGLLRRLPSKAARAEGRSIDAAGFAERANQELSTYRQEHPDFSGEAEVTSEVGGILVSRGRLWIGSDVSVPESRVEALLAHEVGTHLVTYHNGRCQPLQQLRSGLAGYQELQEGLAVLSEHLVGGLSIARMRQLAARVVAVRHLTDGASFVETFRALSGDHGLAQRSAYNVTMRVYRGGGLTKDAVYLRGLESILTYVQKGGDLEPLLVGKIALEHVPTIKELQYRKVLKAAPIVPRYMLNPAAIKRLAELRGGSGSLVDLVADSDTIRR